MTVAPSTPTHWSLHRRSAARRGRRRLLAGRRLGDGGGHGRGRLLEDELTVPRVDANGVALAELALEQSQGQGVLDQALQRPLEWPGAVRRIPAGLGDELLRLVCQLEPESALGQPLEIGRAHVCTPVTV